MSGTSALNLVPMAPTWRQYRLRCRFVIGASPCHRRVGPKELRCRHLEAAAYEAGCRFLEAMDQQGWESSDGRLRITGGPFVATPIGTTTLVRPPRPVSGRGLHPRAAAPYASPVIDIPTVDTADDWEYELSGLFVRPLLPTVMTVSAAQSLQRSQHGR